MIEVCSDLSYCVDLFWTCSLLQCQDCMSLVHHTAVTNSRSIHSLTHIYSISITGFDTLHAQTTAGPPKEWVKEKATGTNPVGAVWCTMGILWGPPCFLSPYIN
ncbi:hypothetical protein CHARACLAT_010507 [Characodon lateralis]|uniref:Uncharacterized protein n=1 Tax=Characodon lateralis TaxID=208331 RepID=A0ABU7DQ03_9TELE|nr:hypothetical protein [Characodon lateralis]